MAAVRQMDDETDMSSIPSVGQPASFAAARTAAPRPVQLTPEQFAAANGEQIRADVKTEAAIRTLKMSQDTAKSTVETLLGSLVDVQA